MAMEGANAYRKGLWTEEEDRVLMDYIRAHGKGKWNQVARVTGLKRCGKSCRLRWINYLSPNVKRGDFSEEEEDLIIRLHNLLGNRWSLIAGRVPGRTDNQVKNHWNTHLSKKLGIKKGAFKVSASQRTCSKGTGKSSILAPELASDATPAGQEAAQDTIGLRTSVGGDNEGSFWSTNDDLNPYTPSLMHFLDCYSLDFEWDGL